MSYIEQINDFWRLRQKERITSHEADLYLYLLHRCNQSRWVNPFELSTKEIERDLNMSRPTIVKARIALQMYELVDFQEGKTKGKPPTYFLKNVKKKPGDCVKEINTIGVDCVKEINTIGVDCVKDCVKEINTIAEKKENFPPHPPYKEKKEIYKEKKTLASLDTHDARAREGVLISGEKNINAIERLRETFVGRNAQEALMRQNGISRAEDYRSICDEILGEWQITKGHDFEITEDVRKHFINLVRIKSEKRRAKGGGRVPTQAEKDAERERKRKEQEAHDATAITFEEYKRRRGIL